MNDTAADAVTLNDHCDFDYNFSDPPKFHIFDPVIRIVVAGHRSTGRAPSPDRALGQEVRSPPHGGLSKRGR